ncbi:MAG: outer membrane protein assembly factor BamA, partial [Gammaproteobacteria bacterium]|nr:outer membrane protein assembly factor BamA [Gammaproteobacteria bacterium]
VLEREGDTLLVSLAERASIASLKFEGNEAITKEQLMENMKLLGFSEGKIFNNSMLDKVVLDLKQQYMALGKYSVKVRPEILQLERNRVDILVKINEGDESSIQHLNIVGNKAYSDTVLKGLFELGERPLLTMFSSQDQYAREKLAGDLERLRSFYMDSGYINFSISSTQVSITPDKSGVYITINLSEGNQYRVDEVKVTGETILPKEEIMKLIPVESGEIFSRSSVTKGNENISEKLGELGYAFANINPIPEIDEEKRLVTLNYYVDPGKRIFVRRINVSGNENTKDKVIRRELRQMESGWISTTKVKRSRERLERLGFFQEVAVSTPTISGSSDMVDLDIKLSENDTNGTFSAGIGYSDAQGITLSTSVSQKNFLGTGESFNVNINTSTANTVYSFSMTDPYSTLNGVSRTLSVNYRKSDATELDSADYTTDTYGAAVRFGVPISEYNTFRYGLNVERAKINTTATTSSAITDFCSSAASLSECSFNTYKINASIDHDTRDKFLFPTKGGTTALSGVIAVPLNDSGLTYYKTQVTHKSYFPLTKRLTLSARGEIAYAGAYNNSYLPPYEYYRAGGVDSVRGYSSYTLGATADTFDTDGKSIGGDMRLLANAELIFPPPFTTANSDSMRFTLFLDAGNVYNKVNGFELSQLRYSIGAAMAWITPIGPLKFSFGVPVNKKSGDQVEAFQFTIGVN